MLARQITSIQRAALVSNHKYAVDSHIYCFKKKKTKTKQSKKKKKEQK